MGTFLFLLSSCESEETIIENGNPSVEKKTITFSNLKSLVYEQNTRGGKLNTLLTKASNKNSNSFSRFEEDSFIKYIDSTEVLQMTKNGVSTFTLRVETKDTDFKNFYNVLIYLKDSQWSYDFLKYTPEITKQGLEAVFDGKMYFVDENGEVIQEIQRYVAYVICGVQVIPTYQCSHGNNHAPDDPQCTVGDGVIVGFVHHVIYCSDTGGASSSTTSTTSTTTESNTNPSPSGGGSGTGNSTTSSNTNFLGVLLPNGDVENDDHADDVYFETMIDSVRINTNLGPCSTTIVNSFLNPSVSTSKKLTKILDRLNLKTGPQSNYTFEIKSDTLTGTNDSGQTSNIVDPITNNDISFNYLVTIDATYNQNATRLAKARTIIHELIHAYLLSLIDDNSLLATTSPSTTPSPDLTSLSGLYDVIERKKYGDHPSEYQHRQMAASFIEIISEALKAYDGASQSNQYYEDLAWGGLTQTSGFLTLYPTGSVGRVRIIATNQVEDENLITGLNTILAGVITPKSTPCQ